MSSDKYESVLSNLCTALACLDQAKNEIGENIQERLLVLDSLIGKTKEAIHRWKFRHGKIQNS
jgi:hypothetical protein